MTSWNREALWGIHRSLTEPPTKGQKYRTLIFSFVVCPNSCCTNGRYVGKFQTLFHTCYRNVTTGSGGLIIYGHCGYHRGLFQLINDKETHRRVFSTVTSTALVIKNQVISNHSVNYVFTAIGQSRTLLLHSRRWKSETEITFWKNILLFKG